MVKERISRDGPVSPFNSYLLVPTTFSLRHRRSSLCFVLTVDLPLCYQTVSMFLLECNSSSLFLCRQDGTCLQILQLAILFIVVLKGLLRAFYFIFRNIPNFFPLYAILFTIMSDDPGILGRKKQPTPTKLCNCHKF